MVPFNPASLDPETFYQEDYHLSGLDYTEASLLLSQLLLLWAGRIKALGTKLPYLPPPSEPQPQRLARVSKFILDPDDFSPEDYTYTKDRLIFADDSTGSCSRGQCDKRVQLIIANFPDRERLLPQGPAQVLYSDNSILVGHFNTEGALHGLVYTLDELGEVDSVAFYDRGWKTGPGWRIENRYGTSVYGTPNSKGAFTTDREGNNTIIVLNTHVPANALVLTRPRIRKGIVLEASQEEPLCVTAIKFRHSGLVMDLEVDKDCDTPLIPSQVAPYEAASNIKSDDDKVLAQSAWFAMQALNKDFIRNKTAYDASISALSKSSRTWGSPEGWPCSRLPLYSTKKGSLTERLFAVYPGSGSKWILNLISFSTGHLVSGCVNTEEAVPIHPYEAFSTFLVKTHHQSALRFSEALPWRLDNLIQFSGRSVILIRNPYEAMISLFNHERSNSYDRPGSRSGSKSLEALLHSPMFKQYVRREISLWEEIYLDFLSLATDVYVMHYENVKEEPVEEMKKIHAHLGVPVESERLECLQSHPYNFYRRKTKPDYGNPYDAEMTLWVEAAIERVQKHLLRRGLNPLPLQLYKFRQ